jgi:hypothetical protein
MSRVFVDDLIAHIARREERLTVRVHDGVRVFALQPRKARLSCRDATHHARNHAMQHVVGSSIEGERQCMNEKGPLSIS